MILHRKARSNRPIYTKNQFEKAAWARNQLVCGIDEVGRGCLAGPVVTAAAILFPGISHKLLKDSKVLTPEERLKAYSWLIKRCWFGIGIVNNRLIDHYNIYQANKLAMKRALVHALTACPRTPEAILIDAVPLVIQDTGWQQIPVYHFIKGEKVSCSVAAASIIAKVTRDRIMERLHTVFPGYYFDEHKGYATAKHQLALQEQQPCLIHRKTFLDKPLAVESEHEEQQSLFEGICVSTSEVDPASINQ
jgi:ribonuclease HII